MNSKQDESDWCVCFHGHSRLLLCGPKAGGQQDTGRTGVWHARVLTVTRTRVTEHAPHFPLYSLRSLRIVERRQVSGPKMVGVDILEGKVRM